MLPSNPLLAQEPVKATELRQGFAYCIMCAWQGASPLACFLPDKLRDLILEQTLEYFSGLLVERSMKIS